MKKQFVVVGLLLGFAIGTIAKFLILGIDPFRAEAADNKSSANFTWAVSTDGPWKDSMVPAAGFKLGAGAPSWGDFTDANIQVLRFSKTAVNYVHGSLQVNHDYRTGTALKPHIHVWFPTAAAANVSTNVWKLTYSVSSIGGTFGASTAVTVTNVGAVTQNEHRTIDFSDISGSGLGISSIVAVTVERTGDDEHDVYDDVIGFLGFDVHYQVDSLGSTQSGTK